MPGRFSREERARYESIFEAEGLGQSLNGKSWEDFVDDDCIHDIVITGEVRLAVLSFESV